MSDLFIKMNNNRVFIEGTVLEPVSRDNSTLVCCQGNPIQLQFDHHPLLLAGQLIQAYGSFEPETDDEVALMSVERFGAFPMGFVNGQ